MCRFIDQVLHVSRALLNKIEDRVSIVLDLDPLLTALHQHLLRYIMLFDENLGIVSFFMCNEHLILIDELLEVFQVQLLLCDTRSKLVVLLGRSIASTDGLHARLKVRGELCGQLACHLYFLRPDVLFGSWLLPGGLLLFLLFFLSVISVCSILFFELLVDPLAVGVHLVNSLQKMGCHF